MTIKELQARVAKFQEDRDWRQFHTPKDLVLSMMAEVAEVGDHFKWKKPEDLEEYLKTNKEEVADELADVLHNVLLMSYELDIDLEQAFSKKMSETEAKYPVEKAKGVNKKYNKL
jgi:NTP pyrophosphatase (non-canonical NTP hydrolase)